MASISVSLMASQTLILQKHTFFHSHKPSLITFPKPKTLISPKTFQFSPQNPKKTLIITTASNSSQSPILTTNAPAQPLLTGSTRTITTLIALAVTAIKLLAKKFTNFSVNSNMFSTTGTLFFAAMSGRGQDRLHTPLSVVAAGMGKWLDIYSGVLLVRVLLSWFPNIPWDRQPLSAIRDLCDPYLNLFRNIIPPVFDTLDVSPLLAFAILGFLGGLLKSTSMGY